MAGLPQQSLGFVAEIWRYPVKSMQGEQLKDCAVTGRGLAGDRAFALIDLETGKVASAKNPRRWPTLFAFRAEYEQRPCNAAQLAGVRITLPNGSVISTEQVDAAARLSAAAGRAVRPARSAAEGAVAEGYWPDYDWLAHQNEVFEFPLPPGTFFDGAPIHVVTTATLERLQTLAPTSRFDVARFRPNIVIKSSEDVVGFVENQWTGHVLAVGEVHLRIEGPCPRCVMTTLSQGDLPNDPGVLRTAVQENSGNVGVYATVVRGGRVRRGDIVDVLNAKGTLKNAAPP